MALESTSSAAKGAARLTNKETWLQWEHGFEAEARLIGMWQYIAPPPAVRDPAPERPVMPNYKTNPLYAKAANAPANPPWIYTHLTPAGQGAYKNDRDIYDEEIRLYEKYEKGEATLNRYIRSTVDPSLYSIHCTPSEPMAQWYDNLRANLSVGEAGGKDITMRQYTKHLATFKSSKDLKGWVRQWVQYMELGRKYMVGALLGPETWARDLLALIKQHSRFSETFYETFRMRVSPEITAGTLDYKTVQRLLEDYIEDLQPRRPRGGAFPTVGGEGPDEDEEDHEKEQAPKEEKRFRGRGGRGQRGGNRGDQRGSIGRGGAGTKRRRNCEACDIPGHDLARCWYLLPSLRPDDWEPRAEIKERVEKRLADSNSGLAEQANKLKKQKRED